MSRSGYSYDCDNLNLYRGTVARALGGKRGQQALVELRDALDGMEDKRLGSNSFQKGECPCTLGVLAGHRDVAVDDLEPQHEDSDVSQSAVGRRFNIAASMAAEIMFENDEAHHGETEEQRWARMRAWVEREIR